MEKIAPEVETVLEVLDTQIEKLEEKLKKAQPWIDRLNKLRQTRRVLLNERGTTSGAGNGNVRLTMEELVRCMTDSDATDEEDALPVSIIAEKLGVNPAAVRSHFNRGKDTRYGQNDNGDWYLLGEASDDE